MKIYFILVILFGVIASAQEQVGEITAPETDFRSESSGVFEMRAIFDSFRNQSARMSGLKYGAELGYQSPGKYAIYFGFPFLYGQVQSKNVSELGNPYAAGELQLADWDGFRTFAELEHHFIRSDALIASRHNTLIPGLELRYDKFKTVAQLGAYYHLRYGEADPSVDVKDIVSTQLSFGRKLSRRFTLEGQVLWYRAFGVKKGDLVFAREADWAGAGPVGLLKLGSGVAMRTSLLFPIHLTRSQTETEVAVWDSSRPKVNEVTWKTDLGVQF